MQFDLSPRARKWRDRLQAFFEAGILPRNREWHACVVGRAGPGNAAPFMPERQAKARAAGLWNPGLPDLADDEPGTRLTNFDYVPLVKIAVPNLLQTIADRAIQVFGAMGGSDDAPIHQALAWARLLRIGDGPDEVHYRQIFKMEAPAPWSVEQSPYLIPRPD